MAGITRFGDRTARGHAAFRCAQCGELAGVVKVARAGAAVDMGPPFGQETQARDGVAVDYFLGTTPTATSTRSTTNVTLQMDLLSRKGSHRALARTDAWLRANRPAC
jgi:hypothetical protein